MREFWSYALGAPTPVTARWRRIHAALLVAVAGVVMAVFWHFGQFVAHRMNDDPLNPKKNHDQTVFLDHAAGYKNLGIKYFAPRQHMPGYGLMLVPFIEKGEDIWHFFERSKTLVVVLSLLALVGLAVALRLVLPWAEVVLLTSALGFLLYVFRAGFFQPELMFFTLFLLSLILMLRLVDRPARPLALATGVVFAAAHLFKSSMLASLALLGAGIGVRVLQAAIRKEWVEAGRTALTGATVPAVFCLLLLPYLIQSKREFGSAFFSAHTKYHMWCDTHDQSRALAEIKVARRTQHFTSEWLMRASRNYETYRPIYEDWAKNGPPSPARYFREHTWSEIATTGAATWKRTLGRLERDYGPLLFFWQALVMLTAVMAALRPAEAWQCLRRHWLAIATYGLFLAGYFVSYVFYAKIGMGPRLFLTLAVPVCFGPAVVLWRLGRDAIVTWRTWSLSLRKVANWILVGYLLIAVHEALTVEIFEVVGGQ
jgi:hypothetical protein